MLGRSVPRVPNAAALVAAVAIGATLGAVATTVRFDVMRHVDGLADGLGLGTEMLYPVLQILPFVIPAVLMAAWLIAYREQKLATISARDAELARMSWRLDFALAASEVGVWDVDLKTDELMWDEQARMLFDVPEREGYYSEADWVGAIHPEDRERAVAAANAAVAQDGRFVQDYRVVLADGGVRHIRDMAAVYRGDRSHRLVGLVWDVTKDVQRQEELKVRRAEAEAATLAKSQFLAAMSHEIRTPMTGVLGMLDLLLDEPLSEKQRERATIAQASARSLLQILNDVLEFSKLEAHRIEIREQDVMPRQVVRDVIGLMAAGAEQKRLSLTYSVADAVPDWIVTDPMRLRQLITNLVSNATKFTEAGQIRVRVDYDPEIGDGELQVEVEDTGIGIDPEIRERLFEEFFQADTSLCRRSGGTGLGLTICRQLVGLMGGTIAVQSEPGGGSTFRFTIRARPRSVGDTPARNPITAASGDGPTMRVLLAEDNPTNQYLIRAYLEAAGHSVIAVENGAQAVRAASAGNFDAVLMDIQMPEVDGPTAARSIRALPGSTARVPIIALTANALWGDRESYLAAGMTDYISKPIDLAALHGALRRARQGKDAVALPAPEETARRKAG